MSAARINGNIFFILFYSFLHNLRKGVLDNLWCSLYFDVPCNRGAAAPHVAGYFSTGSITVFTPEL